MRYGEHRVLLIKQRKLMSFTNWTSQVSGLLKEKFGAQLPEDATAQEIVDFVENVDTTETEQLRNEVSLAQEKVEEAKQEVETLNTEKGELQEQLNSQLEAFNELQEKVDNLINGIQEAKQETQALREEFAEELNALKASSSKVGTAEAEGATLCLD